MKGKKIKVDSHVKSSNYDMWQIILLPGGGLCLERNR